MKLIKITSALSLAAILAACSPAKDEAKPMASASETSSVTQTAQTETAQVQPELNLRAVVYQCQQGVVVSANYDFEGEKAVGLTLTVNDVAVKSLMRDDSNKDFASFVSPTHVWNVDETFTLSTFNKTEAGMLFKKGEQSDEILAKDCVVDQAATAKLNP
ncbi:hypothetical protein [Caviibacterium pharyngocola]|uniref:Lysozyme inhibitor n=1 Tax=Caviibacterium pharyngocola TaxID=28159 RepID=A0A2M8RXX6_9PAST|nr:hypothetical protein [Caviibacterium pharyngocola]PJG83741.1 hypothetical protein CVP04_02460 [Caviibacterium pharyngocola]